MDFFLLFPIQYEFSISADTKKVLDVCYPGSAPEEAKEASVLLNSVKPYDTESDKLIGSAKGCITDTKCQNMHKAILNDHEMK